MRTASLMTDQKVTIRDVFEQVNKLRDEIDDNYVRKESFKPVQQLAFGLAGTILVMVIGAVIGLVIKSSI